MTNTCSHCGKPTQHAEEHHVDQQRNNNHPDNLTPRCTRCHHNHTHDNPRRTNNLTTEKFGPRSPSTGPP